MPQLNWATQFGLLKAADTEEEVSASETNSSCRPSSRTQQDYIETQEEDDDDDDDDEEARKMPCLRQEKEFTCALQTNRALRWSNYLISSVLFFAIPLFRLLFKEEALKFRRKERKSSSSSFMLKLTKKSFCWHRKVARSSLKAILGFVLIFLLELYLNLSKTNCLAINAEFQQLSEDNSFYTNEPQPLVYNGFSHEPGSGDGPPNTINHFNQLIPPNQLIYSSSSSISPSLITAKCWNNYENDNDCKHINVITGSNSNDDFVVGQQNKQDVDDDSIITPVVIFEASSSIEPTINPPPVYLAPPYFSSTAQSNIDNVVLARHRTPPSANERFATPPTGITITPFENRAKASANQGEQPVVTWPGTSVFVATPAPKLKQHKTTTMGRKCRDENDSDCDEPDGGADRDDDGGEDAADDEGDDDNGGESDDSESAKRLKSGGSATEDTSSSSSSSSSSYNLNQNEIGSGDGPRGEDDDDDDGGADEGEEALESSGGSEPSFAGEHTTRYAEVSSIYPSSERPSDNIEQPPDTGNSNRAGAEIEVVVHPTLPPSFPITTTTTSTTAANLREPMTIRNPYFDQPYSISSTTMMPDDTFKSKPVFPSTNLASGASNDDDLQDRFSSNQSKESSYDSTLETSTYSSNELGNKQAELDLATFKSIPMPAVESESMRPLNRPVNSSSESNPENSENKVDSKYKFEPSSISAAPIKFDSPWRIPARVASSTPPGSLSTGDQPWQQLQMQQQQRQRRPQDGRTIMETNQSRSQADMLPTLLLYAAILILIVTTVIFAIMVTLWRRNTAKRRALLHKSRMMVNGTDQVGGHLHQMPGSMSQPSQLVTNMQQPGLLSTYAPGKGMTLGKITTSLANASDEHIDIGVEAGDEDDENRLLNDGNDEDQSNETHQDGSSIETNNKTNDQRLQARTSSWSTEDHTTSSGSQKTDSGQPSGLIGQTSSLANQQQQLQSSNRLQYPNSLSDGRQNSSSISDSQGSPEVRDGLMIMGHPQQQQQHQVALTSQYSVDLQNYKHPHQQQQHQAPLRYDGRTVIGQQYNQPPVIHDGIKRLSLSRSVEDMQQAGLVDMNDIQTRYMIGAPPPAGYQMPPHSQIMHNSPQQPIFKNASHPEDVQRAYLTNPRPVSRQTIDGYLNHNNEPNIRYGPQPPLVNGSNRAGLQFANVPIDPAQVDFNPSATLNRRHQPGLGLNRSIYSEDSSSLMTASPSLVRTSSSSSFAFNGSQASSIRAKPLVDAAGRVFNDYTQTGYDSNGSRLTPARKDRSEPWYV